MKKTLASFLIATMIMAPVNVHASEERIKEIQSQMIELQKELNDLRAEQIGEDIINGTVENGESVLYLSHEVMKDHYGDDCLVVYFNYTNNTEEDRTFAFSVYGKGFQNGIEMDRTSCDCEGIKNANKAIQPGTSLDVALAFKITDDSDVDLEVLPSINKGESFGKQIIKLQ